MIYKMYPYQRIKGFSVLLSKGKSSITDKIPVNSLKEAVNLFNTDTYKINKKDRLNIILTQIQYDDLWIVERLSDLSISINTSKNGDIWNEELRRLTFEEEMGTL